MFSLDTDEASAFERATPAIGRCMSALTFLVTVFLYSANWVERFVYDSDRPVGVIFVVLVALAFITSWHQWKTAGETERRKWNDQDQAECSLPHWMQYAWPLMVLFFLLHVAYLHFLAPSGFVVFHNGKFDDRNVSDYLGTLPHAAYLRLRAAEQRELLSFLVIVAFYMVVYWWLGRGRFDSTSS